MKNLIIKLSSQQYSNASTQGYNYQYKEIKIPVFSSELDNLIRSGFHVIGCSIGAPSFTEGVSNCN